MKLPNLDEKCMNLIENCFLVQKMDVWRNKMLHQILSDCHPGTFSKTKQKGWLESPIIVTPNSYIFQGSRQ